MTVDALDLVGLAVLEKELRVLVVELLELQAFELADDAAGRVEDLSPICHKHGLSEALAQGHPKRRVSGLGYVQRQNHDGNPALTQVHHSGNTRSTRPDSAA